MFLGSRRITANYGDDGDDATVVAVLKQKKIEKHQMMKISTDYHRLLLH